MTTTRTKATKKVTIEARRAMSAARVVFAASFFWLAALGGLTPAQEDPAPVPIASIDAEATSPVSTCDNAPGDDPSKAFCLTSRIRVV